MASGKKKKAVMRKVDVIQRLLTAMTAVILLAACGENIVYSHYEAVEGRGWRKNDTLSFTTTVMVPDRDLDVYVDVRHGNNYPYRNLALSLTSMLSSPADSLVRTDTLRLMLADSEGRWTGEGFTNLYHNASYVTTLRLDTPATCRFVLLPAMQDSLLQGVSDIGVWLVISSSSHVPHQSAGIRTTE